MSVQWVAILSNTKRSVALTSAMSFCLSFCLICKVVSLQVLTRLTGNHMQNALALARKGLGQDVPQSCSGLRHCER